MKKLVLFIFLISFVSAVDVNMNCPKDIFAGKEFECGVDVSGGDGIYDFKVDLDGERNSGLEVWNDGAWKSGYYYVLGFVEAGESKNIKLRVAEKGDYDCVLKLRQGDSRTDFDYKMEVLGGGGEEGFDGEKNKVIENKTGNEEKIADKIATQTMKVDEVEVIALNSADDSKEELVYVSKDGKIVDYLPYAFCLFLIFIIGILMWERF